MRTPSPTSSASVLLGTQLLCEQVIGRALRRQSYDLNDEGLFNVEYADIFGIPFDFTAKPVVAPPQPPRETVQVKAVRPERDGLEIQFPRVEGYMHLAKGLEFRAVVVMACDDEIIPLQERIETVGDDADLQEVYDTERHLLYVSCTRARDHLLVASVAPASEFLDDLRA